MRYIIIGGPNTGKTTAGKYYASEHGDRCDLRHTDTLMDMPWSAASDKIADWITELNQSREHTWTWIIEGTAAIRGLRKWLRANPEGKPCDLVVFMDRPYGDLLPGQLSMAKAITTMWNEIADDVLGRGVMIDISPAIPAPTEDVLGKWIAEAIRRRDATEWPPEGVVA